MRLKSSVRDWKDTGRKIEAVRRDLARGLADCGPDLPEMDQPPRTWRYYLKVDYWGFDGWGDGIEWKEERWFKIGEWPTPALPHRFDDIRNWCREWGHIRLLVPRIPDMEELRDQFIAGRDTTYEYQNGWELLGPGQRLLHPIDTRKPHWLTGFAFPTR